MLESNYLTMLMKPNYEKPVDSPQDIIDRDLTVVYVPGHGGGKGEAISQSEILKNIAERTVFTKVIFLTE